jgi:hypothetical protein
VLLLVVYIFYMHDTSQIEAKSCYNACEFVFKLDHSNLNDTSTACSFSSLPCEILTTDLIE